MPKPYPKEFREEVVAVARRGQDTLAQIAKDFGIAESCLRNWLRAAEVADGSRPGLSPAESEQLRELKRRNRLLECHPRSPTGHAHLGATRDSVPGHHACPTTTAVATSDRDESGGTRLYLRYGAAATHPILGGLVEQQAQGNALLRAEAAASAQPPAVPGRGPVPMT